MMQCTLSNKTCDWIALLSVEWGERMVCMPASMLYGMLKICLHDLSHHPVLSTATLLHLAHCSPTLHVWLVHQLLVPCLACSFIAWCGLTSDCNNNDALPQDKRQQSAVRSSTMQKSTHSCPANCHDKIVWSHSDV